MKDLGQINRLNIDLKDNFEINILSEDLIENTLQTKFTIFYIKGYEACRVIIIKSLTNI